MRKKEIAVYVITIWLVMISWFMLLAASMNLEVLFVLWLIGILIMAELIASRYAGARYYRRLTCFIALGIVLFGLIIINKIQVILNG